MTTFEIFRLAVGVTSALVAAGAAARLIYVATATPIYFDILPLQELSPLSEDASAEVLFEQVSSLSGEASPDAFLEKVAAIREEVVPENKMATAPLAQLNAVYEMELQDANTHLKSMNQFYSTLGKAMENMIQAGKDKEELNRQVDDLTGNLSSLNRVYGNMLKAKMVENTDSSSQEDSNFSDTK